MLLGEGVVLGALQVDDADQPVLEHQRHRQLRPHLDPVAAGRVVRIQVDVRYANGLAQRRRGPGHAVSQREPALGDETLVVLERKGVRQKLRVLVPQHHREHLVVDQPLHQTGDRAQQLLAVQDRRQLTADLVQQRKRARLIADALVEPCVLDPVGEAVSHERQQLLVGLAKMVRLPTSDVEHADRAILDVEGNRHLGAHDRRSTDVARIRRDIAHVQRLLGLGHAADDPLPEAERPVRLDLVGVAQSEIEAQLLPQRVQQ